MESYDHVGFNNTKFRENPRGSCQKVVEMKWNDPFEIIICNSIIFGGRIPRSFYIIN